ncbi:exported hypothetical protein [Rhodospirillaceae bacterium LM-1]|nr:exported hypothetical protein [Rhodospirillaceae bacterium LM-1]
MKKSPAPASVLAVFLMMVALLAPAHPANAAPKRSSKEKMPPSQLVVVEKYNLGPIIQILNGELDEYIGLVSISNDDIEILYDRCNGILTKSSKIEKEKVPGACDHFFRHAVFPQILVNQRVDEYMARLLKLSESRPVTGEDIRDAIGNCALDLRKEGFFRNTGNLRGDMCEFTMLVWYNEVFGGK